MVSLSIFGGIAPERSDLCSSIRQSNRTGAGGMVGRRAWTHLACCPPTIAHSGWRHDNEVDAGSKRKDRETMMMYNCYGTTG